MRGTVLSWPVVGGLVTAVAALCWFITQKRGRSSVKNKVILITGASSGLGEALAHEFYRAGAKVILASRRRQELERVKQDLQNLNIDGPVHEPLTLVLDLEDLASLPQKAEEARRCYGQVDILLNNGGISSRGDVVDTRMEVYTKLMVVNFLGHVALTKALLPHMIENKTGHIVAISSLQGKFAIPSRSGYAASKHALQAFFDSLRAEVSEAGVRVSVVSPGYINTNLSLHALTGDGACHGVKDVTTAQGLSPERAAQKIMDAVCRHQEELLMGPLPHRLAAYLRNILPGLYFKIMSSRAIKQRRQLEKENSFVT